MCVLRGGSLKMASDRSPRDGRVGEQLTTVGVCLCVCVCPMQIRIAYRIHMVSLRPPQSRAHIQKQRPAPTDVRAAHSRKKPTLVENEEAEAPPPRPGPNEHCGSPGGGHPIPPDDVQGLNS